MAEAPHWSSRTINIMKLLQCRVTDLRLRKGISVAAEQVSGQCALSVAWTTVSAHQPRWVLPVSI